MATKWGILTAGRIAGAFASGLKASQSGTLVVTGARDLQRSEAFATQWGGRAVEGYQAVLDDPEVDAVYIATPHHNHAEWTVKAARAGKAILCEKPFTLNLREAQEAIEVVRSERTFFMEAFMYRCSAQTERASEILQDGSIGQIRSIATQFSFDSDPYAGNFRNVRELGGGGILDVGTYCTSFCILVAGECPCRVEYAANLDRGYDSYGAGLLEFPSGIVATLASGIHLRMHNGATVYGDQGWLHLNHPWTSPLGSEMVLQRHGKEPEVIRLGCTADVLYANEADEVDHCRLRSESPRMPWQHTLWNMDTLDRIRESCGLVH